jgi:hypothetical protein
MVTSVCKELFMLWLWEISGTMNFTIDLNIVLQHVDCCLHIFDLLHN